MSLGARRAGPGVAGLGLVAERRVDTTEMEDVGAASAGDRFGATSREGFGSAQGARRPEAVDLLGRPLVADTAASLSVAELGSDSGLAENEFETFEEMADDVDCAENEARDSANGEEGREGSRFAPGAFRTLPTGTASK